MVDSKPRGPNISRRKAMTSWFLGKSFAHLPEYKAWIDMRERCANKSNPYYGGRGIDVCPDWVDSFHNFLADMGFRPTPKHTIERVENDQGYGPTNCIWATHQQQALNRRAPKARLVMFRGVEYKLADLAKMYGIRTEVLWGRIVRGHSIDKAVMMGARRRLDVDGPDDRPKPHRMGYSRVSSYLRPVSSGKNTGKKVPKR